MPSHVLVRAAAGAAAALTIGGLALAASPDPSRTPLTGSVPVWTATTTSSPAPDADTTLAVVLRDGSSAADARAVAEWLDSHGLDASGWDHRTGTLRVNGTRSHVAEAFDTAFAVYSLSSGSTVAPTTALSVPASLPQIVGVSGAVTGDGYRPTASAAEPSIDSPDCAAYWGEKLSSQWPASLTVEHRSNSLCGYTPKQLRAVQQVPDGYRGAGTKVAIVAAFDDPAVAANTDTYSRQMGEPVLTDDQYAHHAPAHPAVSRCGGPSSWTEEQHLDVQAVHAMAPDAKIEYWGADDCTTAPMFLRILDAVNAGPDVISLSFGSPENLDTADDRTLLNRVLVDAASRNISVFASSGNDGDYSAQGDHNTGTSVSSPASSPYLTAVGGTSTGIAKDGTIAVEAGWEIQSRFARNGGLIPPGFAFGSGGGESTVYDRPSWQRTALASHSGAGRLVRDVASLADPNTGFVVYGPHDGTTAAVSHGGDSLATPMVASMVALAKATTGVKIGLASPALYALAGTPALRDVTPASAATWSPKGQKGAIYPETIFVWDTKPQSLQSSKEWDDVTGLGVPTGIDFIKNFGKKTQ